MGNNPSTPGKTKTFVAVIVVVGSFALVHSIYQIYRFPPPSGWLLLAALTLLSGSFTIKVPAVPATISFSETFVFASVLLFGTPAATLTVALDAVIITSWRHRRELPKVLFNATEPTFSIWVASTIFFLFIDKPLAVVPRNISELLGPLFTLCVTYFLLNSWLTAVAVGLATNTSIRRVWQTHFLGLSLNYFVGASVAVLIVQNSAHVGISTLGIILPLLIISYLTMKSSMGRLEDANRYVDQVNRLYLSTIEGLAMAVDAKDQVTHGHIRRVQSLAVGMAKALGIRDENLLKAIEASALLHDMGKLAVPEHILNKPGKLTPDEFERMKTHASIGADILSSIDFPYPVVPIVRHHHERWDGGGYPDGLVGPDIPIGARILSVVDCFDALTSDRPYRKKMSDSEALEILKDCSGSMYDPFVVDTFCVVYPEIRVHDPAFVQPRALIEISEAGRSHERARSEERIRPTYDAKSKEGDVWIEWQSRAFIRKSLSSCFPDARSVVYILDSANSALVPLCIAPAESNELINLNIPFGKGVSGWVAANRQTIFNSDSALDLGSSPHFLGKSCMSAPIGSQSGLFLGVLTIYGNSKAPFTDRDRAVLEALACLSSTLFRRAIECSSAVLG
jgi:putative nucleotidyltransferase with HDIG domain